MGDCEICMGRKRVMVGMSFPQNSTISVKCEYEPCPNCQPGPHSFFARRTMQRLIETRKRRVTADGGGT